MVGERAGSKSSLWVNGVIERTEIERGWKGGKEVVRRERKGKEWGGRERDCKLESPCYKAGRKKRAETEGRMGWQWRG